MPRVKLVSRENVEGVIVRTWKVVFDGRVVETITVGSPPLPSFPHGDETMTVAGSEMTFDNALGLVIVSGDPVAKDGDEAVLDADWIRRMAEAGF